MGMQINANAISAELPAQVEGRYIRVHYLRREGSAKVKLSHGCTHDLQPCKSKQVPLHSAGLGASCLA